MTKFEEVLAATKLNELVAKRDDDEKMKKAILWGLAIIGAVAAIAGIAYAVYRFLTPDYLEDFDDDFDEDFDDDFFEDEEEAEEPKEAEKKEEAEEQRRTKENGSERRTCFGDAVFSGELYTNIMRITEGGACTAGTRKAPGCGHAWNRI